MATVRITALTAQIASSPAAQVRISRVTVLVDSSTSGVTVSPAAVTGHASMELYTGELSDNLFPDVVPGTTTLPTPIVGPKIAWTLTIDESAGLAGAAISALTHQTTTPADFENLFENNLNGTAIDTTNSAYGGTAFDSVVLGSSSATALYDNTYLNTGSMAAKIYSGTGAGAQSYLEWNLTAGNILYGRIYLTRESNPANELVFAAGVHSTDSSVQFSLAWSTTGLVKLRDATGTVVAQTTTPLTVKAMNRVSFMVNGTTGHVELRTYLAPNANALTPTEDVTYASATIGSFDRYRIGNTTTVFTGTHYLDDIGLSYSNFMGPYTGTSPINFDIQYGPDPMSLTDNVVTDFSVGAIAYSRIFTDLAGVSGAATPASIRTLTLTDSVGLGDTLGRTGNQSVSFDGQAGITDQVYTSLIFSNPSHKTSGSLGAQIVVDIAVAALSYYEDFSAYSDQTHAYPRMNPDEFIYSDTSLPDFPSAFGYRRSSYVITDSDFGVNGTPPPGISKYMLLPGGADLFDTSTLDGCEVLTLKVSVPTLITRAALLFDRSWAGNKEDIFYLFINGRQVDTFSGVSSLPWTSLRFPLPSGTSTISWVLKPSNFHVSKLNSLQPRLVDDDVVNTVGLSTNWVPVMRRYLRLANIKILSGHAITPQYPRVNAATTSSGTAVGSVTTFSGPLACTVDTWTSVGQIPAGLTYATVSCVAHATGTIKVVAGTLNASVTAGMSATAVLYHDSDANPTGFVLATHGHLSVIAPSDQTITVKRLDNISVTMPTPIIVRGRPILPPYVAQVPVTVSSQGTYFSSGAPYPGESNHLWPFLPNYRWVANDIGGPDDAAVDSWPEHSGGPAWLASGVTRPTVHPHEHFHAEGTSYITYSRVVHFYWRYAQHMAMTLPSAHNGAFTFQFVMMLHPATTSQYHHILDAGTAQTLTDDQTQSILDGDDFGVNDGVSNRAFLGIRSGTLQYFSQPGARGTLKRVPTQFNRPAVYTICFAGGKSYYRMDAYRISEEVRGTSGTMSVPAQNFVLGRSMNRIGEHYGAHMSIMELGYFAKALDPAQAKKNADYLAAVYRFQLYR